MAEFLTSIKVLLQGIAGIIAALASLIGAIVAMWRAFGPTRSQSPESPPHNNTSETSNHPNRGLRRSLQPRTRRRIKRWSSVMVPMTLFLLVIWVRSMPDPRPVNVIYTAAAWKALKNGQYQMAITNAEYVIGQFAGLAKHQQEQLFRDVTPVPPEGTVLGAGRDTILKRGLINDVGTCYYIKGRSFDYLGQTNDARKAYESATNFPHARCWDPKTSLFWSPSEAAAGNLNQMK